MVHVHEDPPDTQAAGIVLLQGFLQYLCQGIIFSQAVKFWKRSSEDTVYLRTFVITLVVLASLQTAISSYKVWVVAVYGHHWWWSRMYNTDFLVNGLICTFCEVYLVRRCYKVAQRNKFILVSLSILVVAAFFANIYLAVRVAQMIGVVPQGQDPLRASYWAFPVWVYISLSLEVAITSTLSISLWKTRTGYNALDKTLKNIIGITWESAALPCICMITAATLFFVGKHHAEVRHWDLFFILSTAKFYQLGLLRTLNSRIKFRRTLASAKLGRQSLGTWLSGETTVCDRDEQTTRSPMELHEPQAEESLPTSMTPSPQRSSAELANPPPIMNARECGNAARKVDFIA